MRWTYDRLMAIRRESHSGLPYLAAVTQLLQRARVTDADAGMWEAADLQWWWRTPRQSDGLEQAFWVDDDGPAGAVVFTAWGDVWGCDPIVVPGISDDALPEMWSTAMRTVDDGRLQAVETLVPDDDEQLRDLVTGAGFEPTGERSGTMWANADERKPTPAIPAGFMLVDRTARARAPHPMVQRNGTAVEERLKQCSLYDPALDLAVVTDDGDVAGYALFWFDPVTSVGLVEPVRVEEQYWRRGLARAMVLHGLDRLAHRGARRMKVGYTSDAAQGLYLSCGFRDATAAHAFRRLRDS